MDRRKFLTTSGIIGSMAVGGCSRGPETSATNTNTLTPEPQSETRTSEGWINSTEIPDGYTVIHISDNWEVVSPEETKDWDSDTVARFRRDQCKRYFVYEHIPEGYEIFNQGQCTEGVVITVEDNSGRVVTQISLPEKNPDQPESRSEPEPEIEVVSEDTNPSDSTATLRVSYSTETRTELGTDPEQVPRDGFQFVLVEMNITNVGDKVYEISPSRYILRIDEIQEDEILGDDGVYTAMVTDEFRILQGKNISPGDSASGELIFVIPKETSEATLSVDESIDVPRPVTITFTQAD